MIPEPKGKEIVSLLERNITVMMYITIGTRNLQKYVSRTSVVFVSISFIVLMIISLAWLVFYYIQRFRYANARDRNQVSSAGMAVCASKKSSWDSTWNNLKVKSEEKEAKTSANMDGILEKNKLINM